MTLHDVEINGEPFRLGIDSVCETNKDSRGGVIFILPATGKKFFVGFHRFSFVVNKR